MARPDLAGARTATIRGGPLLLAVPLLALASQGCGPERDCTSRVYALPHDPGVDRVQVSGDMTGWEPAEMQEICPCVWHRAFELDPGDWLYELRVDGRQELDRFQGLTGWRDGRELSLLRVPDCRQPAWRVDAASAGFGGDLSIDLAFLRGAGGPGLGQVSATLMDGTALPVEVSADGRVAVRGAGLPPGKHTVTVEAVDGAGTAADPLVLPLWVEDEPFEWEGALVYQVVLDRFATAEGAVPDPPAPGLRAGGDLAGLLRVLRDGYFEALGARAIWISPVVRNASGTWPGNDGHDYEAFHGYWPSAPREVEPALGAQDDLDALVAEAHARGIRVILDVVPNHVHTDHPWYAEHADDWFDGGPYCVCGSEACPWSESIRTCWFTPYLADLDWSDPEVAAAQTDEIAWWVRRFDLDGLRVDAVPMMPLSATREIAWALRQRFGQGGAAPYLLGETYGGPSSWGSIQRFLGPFGLDGQFDFPVMWSVRETLGRGEGSLRDLAQVLATSQQAWDGPGAVMAPMVGNHDVRRFLSEAAGDLGDAWEDPPQQPASDEPYRRVVMAQAVVLSLPGAPVLYYGDEFGMPGGRDPDNRRPMRMGAQLSEPEAWTLARVAAAGRARACLPALRRGALRPIASEDDLLAFARDAGDGKPAIVAVNRKAEPVVRSLPVPADLAPSGTRFVDLIEGGATEVRFGATDPIELPPLSAVLLVPEGACG